jgi:hypothetical protein
VRATWLCALGGLFGPIGGNGESSDGDKTFMDQQGRPMSIAKELYPPPPSAGRKSPIRGRRRIF